MVLYFFRDNLLKRENSTKAKESAFQEFQAIKILIELVLRNLGLSRISQSINQLRSHYCLLPEYISTEYLVTGSYTICTVDARKHFWEGENSPTRNKML